MLKHATKAAPNKTRVEVLTADPEFERAARDIFAVGGKIDLDVVTGTVSACGEELGRDDVTVVVADIGGADEPQMAALERLATRLAGWPPIVVVTPSFDRDMARRLMQMRVADFSSSRCSRWT
jgi:DNA-binding NarL/FixJ family response regulator